MEPDAVLGTWEWADLDAANDPGPPGVSLADVFGAIEEQGARIEALRAELIALREHRPPASSGPLMFSLREAARRLGVSRSSTLPAMIRDGLIRVVTINGRPKIPASEVERAARVGTSLPAPGPAPRRPLRVARVLRSDAPLARDLV